VSLTVLLAYNTLVTTETMSYPNSDPEEESIIHPESGGVKYTKFSYGYSSYKGKRFSMEDFHSAKIETIDGQEIGLFGVFDGHGGSRAAEYLKNHLFENLLKHPKFLDDTKSVITEVYLKTDQDFLKDAKNQNRDAGSTASTAVLVGDHLLVANVGDSRAVICKGGKAVALSTDHKPNQSDERQRIEDAGGVVMWAGTWRVGGILAVSRAFGDRLLKQYVVADPEIQEDTIEKGVDFLVLASDGLWDVVSNEDAVEMVSNILNAEEADAEEAANKLTKEAYRRGSADNITCLIVRFNHNN
jgi:protein phosphatase 1L